MVNPILSLPHAIDNNTPSNTMTPAPSLGTPDTSNHDCASASSVVRGGDSVGLGKSRDYGDKDSDHESLDLDFSSEDEEKEHMRPMRRVGTQSKDYTDEEERVIVRKFDRKLVLFMALLYMLSFLDRSSQSLPCYHSH